MNTGSVFESTAHTMPKQKVHRIWGDYFRPKRMSTDSAHFSTFGVETKTKILSTSISD